MLQNSDSTWPTVSFAPDGRWLASGGSSTYIWELSDLSAPLFVLEDNRLPQFAPDGLSLATASPLSVNEQKDVIHLWDLTVPDPVFTVIGEAGGETFGLAFTPDSRSLVSITGDDPLVPILLWDLSDVNAISKLILAGQASTSLAISPDGATLAIIGGGFEQAGAQGLRLLDLTDPGAPETEFLIDDTISAIAFSPDDRTLATAGADRLIRLWNLDHRQSPPVVLRGHGDAIRALTFSPDGLLLASGDDDGTIRLWPTLDGLREIGCQQVRRNLDQEEWALYLGEEELYRETCPDLD